MNKPNLSQFKAVILDMDGVLWHGERPIEGLQAFFETLERKNLSYILATNNASKRPQQYVEKLARFGIKTATEHILTSGEATASYLRRKYPDAQDVYLVGDQAFHDAFLERGFRILSQEEVAKGQQTTLVAAGLSRGLSYNMLAMASLLVHKGSSFYASNADSSFPSELGLLPGAGAIQAVITTATGVKPTVIGKPEPHVFQEALKRLACPVSQVLMIGDRLGTDILGGQRAGVRTALVLSGVSNQDDIQQTGIKPDYIFEDISDLRLHL